MWVWYCLTAILQVRIVLFGIMRWCKTRKKLTTCNYECSSQDPRVWKCRSETYSTLECNVYSGADYGMLLILTSPHYLYVLPGNMRSPLMLRIFTLYSVWTWISQLHSHAGWKSQLQRFIRCDYEGTVFWMNSVIPCPHYSSYLISCACFWQSFHKMYPDGEFFPETTTPEDVEDEGELSLES